MPTNETPVQANIQSMEEALRQLAILEHQLSELKKAEEERSRTEDLLRKAEERYRLLFESVTDYVYTVKVENGKAVSTAHGPGCFWVTGYTPDEYESESSLWYRMVFEEDRPKVLEQASLAIAGKPAPPLEHRILHKDGTIRWVRNTPVVYKDDAGQIRICEGVIIDITERKQAEEKLQEEERFLSNIFRSVQDGISILDKDLTIIRVNPRMEQWYPFSLPLAGRKCHEAYHLAATPCKICPTRHALAKGEAASETVPKCGPDGEIVGWLEVYAFPLLDQVTGEMSGVIEYVRDVTERKETEGELERRNAALVEANRQLEHMHKAKDEFLAMISHDLRTPLVTGLGYIELLLKGKFGDLSPEGINGLDVSLRNLKRLQSLIEDILQFQTLSMQDYRKRLIMEPFNIVEMMRECVSETAVRFGKSPDSIQISAEGDLVKALGNPSLIHRATSNLLDNACRHAGEARITLSAVRRSNRIHIAIGDNGPGIPAKLRPRAFESFTRSISRREGSGLGLAIVRQIANAHGAEPVLESQEGKGTTVSFSIPIAEEAPGNELPGIRIEAKRILVVEDDADTQDFIKTLLESEGYRVGQATSAEELIRDLDAVTADVALVDITLPNLDGIELCRRFRANTKCCRMPVLMFTARVDESTRKRAYDAGCDGYLLKPLLTEQLLRALRGALAPRPRGRSAVSATHQKPKGSS